MKVEPMHFIGRHWKNYHVSGVMESSNAKNGIVVGASDANSASHDENANTVPYFSGRGSSHDRIKPDIIAPVR